MLSIPITLRNIYFLTHFRIFCNRFFFAKNVKSLKISALNANGLEIKQRVQRDMTLLTFICIMAAKNRNF